jgi:DNA-binding winged helix-turn-helix (wHTH) protein
MRAPISFVTDAARRGNRTVALGLGAIVAILIATAVFLFLNLPDAGAFNARVERLFVETEGLTAPREIRLLEILAGSGTAFTEVLVSYRVVIFVLLLATTALLLAALAFLLTIAELNRRLRELRAAGIQVSALSIDREQRKVWLNDMELDLTEAGIETLAVLAEARMDGEVLTGAQIEAVISGRNPADCEEAAGATRIKRLRDALGNQIVAELLVKTITRRGYVLAVDPGAIRVV